RFAGPGQRSTKSGRAQVFAYFAGLGLGFLFIEIAFIQRFVLFLGHPLYAIAVVLAAFLVFAGLGSGYAERLARLLDARLPRLGGMAVIAVGIAALAGIYIGVLPALLNTLLALPEGARIALAVLLIAPLAFLMGMPFPLGLARLSREAPGLIPWAWGINSCASVLSAVLATILAIHIGFTAVVGCALVIYMLAAAAFAGGRGGEKLAAMAAPASEQGGVP
ncbi:MAG: SAM-dependent methyltransferase, partial [Alphaproteobacteria bacterium]